MNQISKIIDMATLEELIKDRQPKLSEKQIAFNKARFSIVYRLLTLSYYAIGIQLPEDAVLSIRAAQIAENFDCGNEYLRSRFNKAIEIKGLKDLHTPITTGDLTNADRLLADADKPSCSIKYGAIPSLKDKELWTDEMKAYALSYEQQSLRILCNSH